MLVQFRPFVVLRPLLPPPLCDVMDYAESVVEGRVLKVSVLLQSRDTAASLRFSVVYLLRKSLETIA